LEYLDRSTNSDFNRLAIAGYSFGDRIALEASLQSPLIQTVALIGCPISSLQESRIHALAKPALFVSGENDHMSPNNKLLQIIKHFSKRPEVLSIHDADHFLSGYETDVTDIVARFLKCRLVNTTAG
jgi:alpha/beta superfamily hydrolase